MKITQMWLISYQIGTLDNDSQFNVGLFDIKMFTELQLSGTGYWSIRNFDQIMELKLLVLVLVVVFTL